MTNTLAVITAIILTYVMVVFGEQEWNPCNWDTEVIVGTIAGTSLGITFALAVINIPSPPRPTDQPDSGQKQAEGEKE